MSGATHVAFDLGAESGRAMLGSFDGERVQLEEVRRFPTQSIQLPDGLYWNALGLHAELTAALARVAASGARPRSIGIDSWAVDFGLLDRHGALLRNPLSYRDGRGSHALRETLARGYGDEIYAVTGIQFLPINTLYQLLALAAEERLEQAATLLLIPDLMAYWLTGESVAEATNASTTQLVNAHSGAWASDLIERLGVPARILPPIAEPGAILGGLLPHVTGETGLPATTPVALVASHDTASAVVAAPLAGRSAAFISSGTWSLVGVELEHALPTPEARSVNLTNERAFGGGTRLLKNVMGLWLVQECRREWLRHGEAPEYAELAELAAGVPSGALFDPDAPELLAPGDMPARIRAACRRAGQAPPGDRPALLRAIFDSLACKYRLVLEQIEGVTGRAIDTIHVIGGGSRNAFLCQLTADVTRRVVLAGPAEAAALGNVLVQLHAFGELASLEEMRHVVRRSAGIRTFDPDPAPEAWESLYSRFRTALDAEVLTP
jgi:rhamnulokinase